MTEQNGSNRGLSSVVSRRALLAGVAVAATGTGLGLSWVRQSANSRGAMPEVAQDDMSDLWRQTFEALDGRYLQMAELRGKPLLINFWATWCPPCIEELPLLNAFYQKNAANGWQILGIAIDQRIKVEQFLKKMPLAFPVVVDASTGTQWSKALGNLTGSLPFSVAFSAKSLPIYRKIGRLSEADLAGLAQFS